MDACPTSELGRVSWRKKRIGIIGGGLTGLVSGLRLAQAGHQVTVLESNSFLGGQAATFPVEGTRLEIYYHHVFTSDTYIVGLINELGLGGPLAVDSLQDGLFSWRPGL